MERGSEVRHEYYEGEVFAMVGASLSHNLIVTSFVKALSLKLDRGCLVCVNDMRIVDLDGCSPGWYLGKKAHKKGDTYGSQTTVFPDPASGPPSRRRWCGCRLGSPDHPAPGRGGHCCRGGVARSRGTGAAERRSSRAHTSAQRGAPSLLDGGRGVSEVRLEQPLSVLLPLGNRDLQRRDVLLRGRSCDGEVRRLTSAAAGTDNRRPCHPASDALAEPVVSSTGLVGL